MFPGSGALVAHARTPDGSDLLEVGDEYVVLLVRNELDEERVTVVPLSRENCPTEETAGRQ